MPNTKESKEVKPEFNKEETKDTGAKSTASGADPIQMGGESILFPEETVTPPVDKVEEKSTIEPAIEKVVEKQDTEEKGGANGVVAFIAGLLIGAFITSLFL